jgi:hypothetical protein
VQVYVNRNDKEWIENHYSTVALSDSNLWYS